MKVRTQEISLTANAVIVKRTMPHYPAPHPLFQASPLTDVLLFRLKRYYDDREPLPPMVYWFINRLEKEYGDRPSVARDLNVSKNVLKHLGILSSDVADPKIGRKAVGTERSYTAAEFDWLEKVVVRLIQRVGEVNAGGRGLQKITLADFPQI